MANLTIMRFFILKKLIKISAVLEKLPTERQTIFNSQIEQLFSDNILVSFIPGPSRLAFLKLCVMVFSVFQSPVV